MRGTSPLLLLGSAAVVGVRALGPDFREAKFNMTVDASTVTECGNVKFEWSGGVAPYQLIVMAPTRPATIFNVPSISVSSAEWLNPYATQTNRVQQIMFFMTDANQDRTDATDLISVGARASGASCKVIDGAPDWFFQQEPQSSTLDQCSTFKLSWPSAKIETPVTSLLAIPNGMVYSWESASDSTFTDYKVNVQSGARVVFSLWDSTGEMGGATNTMTISSTSDKSCLDRNTLNITSGAGAVVNDGDDSKGNSGSTGIPKGTVIGIAVGVGGALLLAFGGLIWWLRKRWEKRRGGGAQEIVDLYDAPGDNDHAPLQAQSVTPFYDSDPRMSMSDPRASMVESEMSYLTSQPLGDGLMAPGSPDPRASTFSGYSQDAMSSASYGPISAAGAALLSSKFREAQSERTALLSAGPGGSAPAGPAIFRMHDDAGPLSPAGPHAHIPEEVIDLPPNYRPEWQQGAAAPSSSPPPKNPWGPSHL